MTLSDAKLREIADKLFLLKRPAPAKLPMPINTGPDTFTSKLAPIGENPLFKKLGIGVVDFTEEGKLPKVWLHNGDRPWRIGSTCKLALHLAAVQLRDDVRQLQNLISTADEFDELFRMKKLWNLYRGANKLGIQQIAGKENAPRISTIFDLTKSPVDFIGPFPDAPNADDIYGRLPVVGHSGSSEIRHLTWEKVGEFDFSELLWLTGAFSDNVAATAIASEIGLPYIKAVQRAYGLFDPPKGMYLQLSGALSQHDFIKTPVLVDSTKSDGAKYRPLTHVEKIAKVTDFMKDSKTGKFTDQYSWEPGSATALTAYMIALMQDKLVDPTSFLFLASDRGRQGCDTIRNNLSTGGSHSIISYLAQGVESFSTAADITRKITKIGILGIPDGERSGLICEFAYLETKEIRPPNKQMKFAVLVTGISGPILPGFADGTAFLCQQLGEQVHLALLK